MKGLGIITAAIGLFKDMRGKVSSKRVAGLGGGTTLLTVSVQQIEANGATWQNVALVFLSVACYYITAIKES